VIVREEDGSLVLVRQSDHAMLSGWLAAAWGAGPWEPPEPYDSTVIGARLHDLAWTPFDEALPLRPDGRPYSFIEVSRVMAVRLYAAGLDAVESIDAYAGLLNSLHYSGFYTSHWGWQHWGRPEGLEGEERQAVEGFVATERARQQRLRERLGIDDSQDRRLMCSYFWLQLWDRISLDICRFGFHGHAEDYPAMPARVGTDAPSVRLHLELEPDGTCRLDPYPLLTDPYRAQLPAARVPLATAASAGELRRAWVGGSGDAVEVTFRSR
jgi:hypothetical protein